MATDYFAGWTGWAVLLVASWWGTGYAAVGQEAASESPSPESLLREAYEKTKASTGTPDYDRVIGLCQQAQQGEPSAEVAAYADELAAWAHNRRGEARTDRAAELDKQDQSKQAAELNAQALADFETAVKLDSKNWKALHNRAVSRALAGQSDEALADFRRVVELNADYANAWFNIAEIHADRGEYDQAIANYDQAAKLKADDYDTHLRRGHAYRQLRKFQDALANYDRAARLAPDQVEPLLNRGDVYRRLGQWQSAAEEYRRAMALNHRSGQAHQRAAWFLATCPLDRYRNADLAVQAAEKALELDGEGDVKYLDTVAAAYANAGQFDKACQILARILKSAPAEAVWYRQRFEMYQKQQPYREPQPADFAGH
ncbi:MAG: tetratricopeptide repeat protein [Candidatus Anammoximicrobium sp.]|nr:tetratricopeptide repeat protein [Candidatus Anammoximicrobium sp.]